MEKIVKANADPAPLQSFKNSRVDEDGKPMKTTYDNLQNPEKNLYKKALLKEQFYLCAYCNRSLLDDEENLHNLKIEHWYPQHFCKQEPDFETINGLDLQHSNLLIVCGGENANPKYRHCDSSRTPNKKLFIKPQDIAYEFDKVFRYEGTKIVCDDDDIQNDVERELNLNDPDLQHKRFIVLGAFRKLLLNLGIRKPSKDVLLKKYSNPFSDGTKAEYCTLIVNEINKL